MRRLGGKLHNEFIEKSPRARAPFVARPGLENAFSSARAVFIFILDHGDGQRVSDRLWESGGGRA
jgi:hypothetical protein